MIRTCTSDRATVSDWSAVRTAGQPSFCPARVARRTIERDRAPAGWVATLQHENEPWMLGVFDDDPSYQWMGEFVDSIRDAQTKFGWAVRGWIGPYEAGAGGIRQRNYKTSSGRGRPTCARSREHGGLRSGGHQARDLIFRVIFKGDGPGRARRDQRCIAGTSAPRSKAGVARERRERREHERRSRRGRGR